MTGAPVIVIGSGGHAKVVIEALRRANRPIAGRTDADPARRRPAIADVPFLGNDEAILGHSPDSCALVVGLGSTGDATLRRGLFSRFRDLGYDFATVVHPTAVVADGVHLDPGAQVMAGAVIQPGCRIGANAIVNSGAVVDHDCMVGEHVHIAPGAVVSGGVTVGAASHVGAGATVLQNVVIGGDCVIAAGAVVIRPIPDGTRVAGVPAREI